MTTPVSPQTTELPSRAATNMSSLSEDAVPDFDPSTSAGLLAERLQAWKHACGYLEEYMAAVEKIHGKHAKEYERALKVRYSFYLHVLSTIANESFDLDHLATSQRGPPLRPVPRWCRRVLRECSCQHPRHHQLQHRDREVT